MKNVLEIVNKLLNDKTMNLEEFKEELINVFNNNALVDIVIKKGINEGNLKITSGKIRLAKKFHIKQMKTSMKLCLSMPPFEKVALKTILETNRVDIITIESAFKSLIKNSRRSIKICSPFFQLNGWKRLEYDLVNFLTNGGRIEIICRELEQCPRRKNDINNILNNLRYRGINDRIEFRDYHFTKKYIESSTHAKLFISDNQEAYIGSGEVRKNSFDLNFEMGVLIKGDLVKDIEQVFDFMFKSSNKVVFENEN